MPELPEVENIKRELVKELIDKSDAVQWAELKTSKIRNKVPQKLVESLKGAKFLDVQRRAKFLIFSTSKGYVVNHLGMTGQWNFRLKPDELGTHDHFIIQLKSGRLLVYTDIRRFGVLDWCENEKELSQNKALNKLGIEPFDLQLTAEYLYQISRKSKQAIKIFIMDQRHIVGIGNIYASEILFLCKIKPTRLAMKLSLKDCENIIRYTRAVLEQAIKEGGSSIRDYKRTNGESGKFQELFLVYGRSGQACKICGARLKSKLIGSRNSFWCPHCQKS